MCNHPQRRKSVSRRVRDADSKGRVRRRRDGDGATQPRRGASERASERAREGAQRQLHFGSRDCKRAERRELLSECVGELPNSPSSRAKISDTLFRTSIVILSVERFQLHSEETQVVRTSLQHLAIWCHLFLDKEVSISPSYWVLNSSSVSRLSFFLVVLF